MRAMFKALGCSDEAAVVLTDQQGLTNLEEFAALDDDMVKTLCATTRKPGGQVPDGHGGFRPNHGVQVSLTAEMNLKFSSFYLRYLQRTSQPLDYRNCVPSVVRQWKQLKDYEDSHKDADAPEINASDWTKTIESIEEWLRNCLGVEKTPLAHVIRPDHEVGPYQPGVQDRADELFARYPHYDPAQPGAYTVQYLADREKVWNLICDLTRSHDCWTFVRKAQKERDGRAAFFNLKNHFLGPSHIDSMAKAAELRLTTLSYSGEQRRWNFQRYVKGHVDQHIILEGLVQYGYAGIDKRTKVRHLMDGIKTTALDPVKSTIIATPEYRHDFDKCVGLFVDFLGLSTAKAKNNVRDVTVAAMNSSGGRGRGKHGGKRKGYNPNVKPDMSIPDRYYKWAEYKQLSDAQKAGLDRKRDARGSGAGGASKKQKRSTPSFDERTIKAIAAAISAEAKKCADDDKSDDRTENGGGNRNNPALRRN